MSNDAPRKTTLTIRQDGYGTPVVLLGGLEVQNLLLGDGGLKIDYVPAFSDGPSAPRVTMVFGPGAFEFDFDVDLLRSLLEVAERDADDAVIGEA